MRNSRKLQGGIIGGGKNSFIGYAHMGAAALDGEAVIVGGVFSGDPEKGRARGAELGIDPSRVYPDYHTMIEGEKSLPQGERMDFVILATPNANHYELALAFLREGFHVFSDKPMATSLEQAREIRQETKKQNRLYALTHGYTGYPMIKQARHLVESGALGELLRVVVEYTQGWLSPLVEDPENFKTWHLDPRISGPSCTMIDVGLHAINLVQTVTGLIPEKVCADLASAIPGNALDDNGSVLIRFSRNVPGLLHASQISSGEGNALRIRLYGTRGGLFWDQENPDALEQMNPDGTSTIYKKGNPGLCEEARKAARLPGGHPEGLLRAFANIYQGGFRAIRGEEATPGRDYPCSFQGAVTLAFLEAVLRSDASKEKWIPVERVVEPL
jgi:predicted dehydrogenase